MKYNRKSGFLFLIIIAMLSSGCLGKASSSIVNDMPVSSQAEQRAPVPSSQEAEPFQEPQPEEKPVPEKTSYSLEEEMEAIWAEIERSPYPSQRLRFLNVTDRDGEPVSNIKCYTKDEYHAYLMDSAGKSCGLSGPSGLLPVSLLRSVADDAVMELVLVNADAQQETIQELTLDLAQVSDGQPLSVIWEEETPAQSAAEREDILRIQVVAPDGTPVPGLQVNVEEAANVRGDVNLGRTLRQNPRYTDERGESYAVVDSSFSETFRDGKQGEIAISVEKGVFFYVGKQSETYFEQAYIDGHLAEVIQVVWEEEASRDFSGK